MSTKKVLLWIIIASSIMFILGGASFSGVDFGSFKGIIMSVFAVIFPVLMLIGSIIGFVLGGPKVLLKSIFIATWAFIIVSIAILVFGILDFIGGDLDTWGFVLAMLNAIGFWFLAGLGAMGLKSIK
ncbi:hypothetical protein [Spiroplasma endosymbiont of Othius punctulatus]|uniref:hypothetical protein n=1 Tax=Spiroplasma endosymbiont of Othius punctulatus TaxID=3066289 RepID=UPI0030CEBFAA